MNDIPLWRIRQAGPDDAEALALIGAATFLEAFAGSVDGRGIIEHCRTAHSAETYRGYFARGAKAWLAEVKPGDAPVGYAMICAPELAEAQEGDIELKRIYILTRFQGSLMAGTLMRTVVEAAEGCRRLLLGVKDDNLRALAFYAKNGFEQIGSRQFDIGGQTYDDLVLARSLAPAQA